jgi:hypothetical protein
MQPALDPAGHRVPRTKPTCLLHTWRPHRQRPFVLVLHLHQHESSHNLHLQYLAKNQSTQCCQSLITQGSDHPLVLEPHMVLITPSGVGLWARRVRRCVIAKTSVAHDFQHSSQFFCRSFTGHFATFPNRQLHAQTEARMTYFVTRTVASPHTYHSLRHNTTRVGLRARHVRILFFRENVRFWRFS